MHINFHHRHIKKYLFIVTCFLLIYSSAFSQKSTAIGSDDFRLPLDLPVSLSGGYGELRETHFHAGLDFRIGGVVGAKIYASKDGYISRISISPVGYGNALYISHHDGTTTVYGHLLDYAPKIADWIKNKQYEKESFVIDLALDSTLFPVKKGEFVGRAGNSGSSGGPHLHFEIRETASQTPLDPVSKGNFNVPDNVSPQINKVNFYSISNYKALPIRFLLKSCSEPIPGILSLTDTFYISVAAIDKMNNTNAKLAIADYSFYLDNEKIYSFNPLNIPFDKGKYVNSLVEYSEKKSNGSSMVKSWVEPGNALVDNIFSKNDGLFILKDSKVHIVKVEVKDYKGNRSTRIFKVKNGIKAELPAQDTTSKKFGKIMPWFIQNNYEMESMKLTLPIGALYSSISFAADTLDYLGTTMWRIHNENTPLQLNAKLSVKQYLPLEIRDKAIIAKVAKNGALGSVGGVWKGDYLEANISSFGNYIVTVDTLAPKIFPSIKKNENISSRKAVKFTISDDLSGISFYKVYIDGKWILANFDSKNRSLIVTLDSEKINKGRAHNLEISVGDNRDNINVLNTSFIW